MFDLAGITDSASHASRIMALETEIASYHWDTVRSRDAVLTFNKKTFAEISALAGPFNWHLWADNAGVPRSVLDSVVIAQPDFIENMGWQSLCKV
jgi:predicted metalloendopeptidase